VLQETPGIADAFVSREENYPQFDIVVDREKAAAAGGASATSRRPPSSPSTASQRESLDLHRPAHRQPVQRGGPARRGVPLEPRGPGRLFVTGDGGRPVLLGNLAEIRQGTGPVMIERKYQQRIIKVSANPTGRDLGALSEEIEARFKQLALRPGSRSSSAGQTVQQREAFGSLKFTTLLALVLVYMVMASQFPLAPRPVHHHVLRAVGDDRRHLGALPHNTTLNVTSFMGIIMMVGIVVSNGVLLVEYINELRRHGQDLIPAVINGGRTRLRPILMTSLTTLVGLLPMALGIDVGSEANAPLARAVIGGLAVSTVLHADPDPDALVMVEDALPATREDPGSRRSRHKERPHDARPPQRTLRARPSRCSWDCCPAWCWPSPPAADPMAPRSRSPRLRSCPVFPAPQDVAAGELTLAEAVRDRARQQPP
jgi:multidrug efflux pump subunit AcrB